MPAKAESRSILIEHNGSDTTTISDIPAGAKITFGPVQPGSKDGYRSSENVLRIYTTANNQLAVFRDVQSFRDLSLTVKRTTLEVEITADEIHGPNGSEVNRSVRRRRVDDDE